MMPCELEICERIRSSFSLLTLKKKAIIKSVCDGRLVIMEKVKAWLRRETVGQAAAESHQADGICFIPFTYCMGTKSIWKETRGEFNSVFIAAGVCTCSRYYQHARRTSNNTILLLMTTTKPTAVNIIHGRNVRRQLCWQKHDEAKTGQRRRGCGQKVDLFGAENEIRSSLAFWSMSVIGLSFMRWSRSGRICW